MAGKKRELRHNRHRSAEYQTWSHIKRRCLNPRVPQYKDYGGRGITICDEWRESFPAFYKDMGDKPGPEFSIDRIDNEKGYSKQNCRWATRQMQARNTRRTRMISHNGKKQCLEDWASELGFSRMSLVQRLRRYSVEVALSPLRGMAFYYFRAKTFPDPPRDRVVDPAIVNEVIKLRATGMSYEKIGKQFNKNPGTIFFYVKRWGPANEVRRLNGMSDNPKCPLKNSSPESEPKS